MLKKTLPIIGLLFIFHSEYNHAQSYIKVEMEDGTIETMYFQDDQVISNNEEKPLNTIEIEFEDGTRETMLIAKNSIIENEGEQEKKDEISKPAYFPGGEKELYDYLLKNFKYPEEVNNQKIDAEVYVQFIIKKDGSIENPKIINSTFDILNEPVLELISSMPKWKPAISVTGETIDSEFVLPFKLNVD